MKKRLLQLLFLLTLASASAYAQTVTGTVTSASDGTPVPGVSVLLKGSTTGTSTDSEGKFTLSISDPQNSVLVISFIGFATPGNCCRKPDQSQYGVTGRYQGTWVPISSI